MEKRAVGREDRENAILDFLDSHAYPMPPAVIYRGLKIEREITFSKRTVENLLRRLLDEGHVFRTDKDALDAGRIEPLADESGDRRTYYFITEKGRERLSNAE